jgi:hypothetical protein
MLHNTLHRVIRLLEAHVSYDRPVQFTATGKSSQLISTNISTVNDIIHTEFDRLLNTYTHEDDSFYRNKRAIIKSYAASQFNGTSYPNSKSEINRVNDFFPQETQTAIKKSCENLIVTLQSKLKPMIEETLKALHGMDNPYDHEQWFIHLVATRLTIVFGGNILTIESMKQFIHQLNIILPD